MNQNKKFNFAEIIKFKLNQNLSLKKILIYDFEKKVILNSNIQEKSLTLI